MRGELQPDGSAAATSAVRRAALQFGVISRAQLLEAGLSRWTVDRWLATGRLHPLHRGVFALGHPVLAPHAREMAAVLATGGVLSHRSAAALYALLPYDGDVEVTTTRALRSRAGIVVHRTRSLPAEDVWTYKQVLLVASPTRTLAQLRQTCTPREVERAIEQAEIQRLIPRTTITPTITRSEAEERMLRLIRDGGLPQPEVNARVEGLEVDFLWRDESVIVEVDGFAFHGHQAAFERDRRRDAMLLARGYVVVRITWRQLVDHPRRVLVDLAQVLARRAA